MARIVVPMGFFDRYELVRLLGRGGAGQVYLARDRLHGGREVALKSITARVDAVIRAAFEREFAMLSTLRVPGVAPVYDFGVRQSAAGTSDEPFFTRAYVAGTPLDTAVQGRDLTARLELWSRAAAVIAPLHRVGVVHGDIKPGNIIVDTDQVPWLIDFGLARARAVERTAEVHGPIGTPSFMAPELLTGHAPSVAGDVYALGVTLWLLVTGKTPFEELGARALEKKLEGQRVSLPETRDPRVRAVLEVAARALEPEPTLRFPCVEELQASLERVSKPAARPERAFIPPRPRGHEHTLATIEAHLASAGASSFSAVLHAAHGGGKSLFLCELRWRRQLASQLVLEVFASQGSGVTPLISLFEQLEIVLGREHPASVAAEVCSRALRDGQLLEARAAEALGASLQAVAAQTPLAIFVDDLDRADASLGAILRSALHAHPTEPVAIIATASDLAAPAILELQADRHVTLPRLTESESTALCLEALGPLDSSVVAALVEHAQGLPGALASAFYQLSELAAVTPADVVRLPAAESTLAITQARIARLAAPSRRLLEALSLIAGVSQAVALEILREGGAAADATPEPLREAGLVAYVGDRLVLADGSLRKALWVTLAADGRRALARALSAAPYAARLSLVDRAALSAMAEDVAGMRALIMPAAQALLQSGAPARAAELLEALLPHADPEQHGLASYSLASIRHSLGEDTLAAELALAVAAHAHASSKLRTDAYLLGARALTALGRWDDAIDALRRVPKDAEPAQRAQVQQELAKVHLRRGDYAAVSAAVEAGLACTEADGPVRVELLCSQGIVASYSGDQIAARSCYEQALALARARGVRSEEANVLSYLAIGYQRSGDMLAARDLLAQGLDIARDLGDVGSMARSSMNLGAVFFYLGEPAAAAEHYASAARLARRAGRSSTRLYARANLAHLHVYFGLYERARSEISEVLGQAQVAEQRATVAQLTALSAELAARTGDVEQALIRYDDAVARFAALGRTREVAEHNLDAAEALLDRGGPADASAAALYLSRAREHLSRERADDLRLRLDLLVARARLESGEPDAAARSLEDIVSRARASRARDAEWPALAALAVAQERCGSMFAAKHSARAAVEVLEDIALRIPREHRDAFWQDPRRRAVRDHANRSEHTPHAIEAPSDQARSHERERLFQILRRLASEHDLSRLLERIIESAVDLSGAEHGSVLLVDEQGQLSPHINHAQPALSNEAHELFSRSIAEAVLIDGEPIVTVDAITDGRLQSYVSVHKLMLRSVACLPIRSQTGIMGVLYLEHRRSRGRFSEDAVELLCAFADQAAIALENARLLAEIRKQKAQLEDANRELTQAKAQLEDMLLARTRQLDDVQRELSRTIRGRESTAKHGIVGKTPSMQRLLDGIARLASSTVPVVICGETGTGKELVARAIHYGGARAAGPFVTIDCGSLPETLLESELFGYVKGAFSGADRDRRGLIATASSGTLFLDEVSEMPPKMQASLLRVLQERKVCRLGSEVEEPIDVRLVTATRKPLRDLVARGQFREDLLYRLNVVELAVPALRERREDIPALCDHLLREFAARESVPRCHLTRGALASLMAQPWPGNVRQLGHVLLQACVMSEGSMIDVNDLSFGDSVAPGAASSLPPAGPEATRVVENVNHHRQDEKQRILHALEAAGWNRVKAAQALGMPRRTFYRRLTDYSII